jgi:hypothetical protein
LLILFEVNKESSWDVFGWAAAALSPMVDRVIVWVLRALNSIHHFNLRSPHVGQYFTDSWFKSRS